MKIVGIIFGLVISAALLVAGISVYLQPNSFVGCQQTPTGSGNCRKADAIVAVSGGDTSARTDAAIRLYKNGWGDRLIFSGAAQDKSGPSNAAVMQARAIAQGVPKSSIEIDEQSIDTEQNAANSDTIFQKDNIHSIILVTSGYHQRRAYLEFKHVTHDITIYNAPTDDSDWNGWWWLTPRGWWLAGVELLKIGWLYLSGGA